MHISVAEHLYTDSSSGHPRRPRSFIALAPTRRKVSWQSSGQGIRGITVETVESKIVKKNESKTGRGTETRAGTGSEIENETGIKIEYGVEIRTKSLIGIEIRKMKGLFAAGFVQIGIVIGNRIRIESGTGKRIENGNRITFKAGGLARGERVCERLEIWWSSPPIGTRNPIGVIRTLPAFRNGMFDGEKWGDREGVGHCNPHSMDEMQQRKLLFHVRVP
ncbi:hypothetical protein EVAR_94243_1 [Eumeta japonica]|uniref:Uncharacterized protein n=1 Tax=Eumeta variegata TaxID=151549 RepID=A0A4C1UND0_EUMVA|nr:hypothetical protein EVAR_94243_1 [Eumeta japonica]